MPDYKKVAEMLQDNEIKVLKALSSKKHLTELAGMTQIEFTRAGMWLENKGLISIRRDKKSIISLDVLGQKYYKEKLPEARLLSVIQKGKKSLAELSKHFPKDELTFALGYLKNKGFVTLHKGVISATETGKKTMLSLEGKLLIKLGRHKHLELGKVSDEERYAYQNLKARKQIVKEQEKTITNLAINAEGKKALSHLPKVTGIGKLTPALIKSGSWKGKRFRRYDVSVGVPSVYPGKKQPYFAYLDEVREKLVELGFKEMTGPMIETEFWNFDALFQPQNHPARAWTDTYVLKEPEYGSLPSKKIVDGVRDAHEKGGGTGSIGWQYKWSDKIASRLVPRAHGTALSARQLAKGVEVPGKYFSIARCFRPDVLDATHLIEFNQVEGIIIDDNISFQHLLGILKQMAIEIAGAEKVEFVPDYYPFTEPSVQVNAYTKELGWVEIAGAGIFRPELTKALGIKQQVLAWGPGIDRFAMLKLGVKDIRYLFSQDINWLRKEKIV